MEPIPLPLPPLNEQSRIVAKIEELFSDLDAGVAALQRAKANLKRYRAAVLKAAVQGKLTEAWRAAQVEAASCRFFAEGSSSPGATTRQDAASTELAKQSSRRFGDEERTSRSWISRQDDTRSLKGVNMFEIA